MKKLTFVPLLFIFIHLMYASDGPNVWSTSTTSVGRILALAINPASQNTIYAGSLDSGVFKSTNAGANWFTVNSGLTSLRIQSMAVSPSNPNIIYAGTDSLSGANSGVYKTTNAGANWTFTSNSAIQQRSIQSIAIHPANPDIALIGVFNAQANSTDGIYKTTNGGTTWFPSSTGTTQKNILSLVANPLNGNVYYAGTSFTPPSTGPTFIYKTADAGNTWVSVSNGLPTLSTELNPVRDLSISRSDTSILLAALFNNSTNGGAYWTSNGGGTWTKRHDGLPNVTGVLLRACLIRPGSTSEYYVGIDNATSGGVYRTTNSGLNWVSFNSGPIQVNYAVRAFTFKTSADSTLFCGVGSTAVITPPGMGIYEYTWIPVGISGQNGSVPKEFALLQNFPNPFNPVTVIQYDIPREAFATLKVYDVSGKEVRTLFSETKRPGTYQFTFNGSGLTSGVYFYKLTAGDFTATKKMIIVK